MVRNDLLRAVWPGRLGAGKTAPCDAVIDLTGKDHDSASKETAGSQYDDPAASERYRNFLDWLFESFGTEETVFRQAMIARLGLKSGDRVLITGCGLGDDIPPCQDRVGHAGEVHAQDLSASMVRHAASRHACENTLFTVSSALDLPYVSGYFDAVFHFGGINLFGDVAQAVAEMDRVCRDGGRVVFGDEGIGPHLRATEYGRIAIGNNALWAHEIPLEHLPATASDIELSFVLGNCFYVIGFTSRDSMPFMNIDVPHKGWRGGTARTRYFGQLEGVTGSAKSKIERLAKSTGRSVHELLSELIEDLPVAGPAKCEIRPSSEPES